MADAYDIMQMAKMKGAQAQSEEDLEKYEEALEKFREENKPEWWESIAQIGLSKIIPSILEFLVPGGTAIKGALGLLLKGGIGGTIQDQLMQAIKGKPGDIPEFVSSVTGPYGQKGVKRLKQAAGETKKGIQKEIDDMRDDDRFLAYASSFAADLDDWLGLGKEAGKGIGGFFGGEGSDLTLGEMLGFGGGATDALPQTFPIGGTKEVGGFDRPKIGQFSNRPITQEYLQYPSWMYSGKKGGY